MKQLCEIVTRPKIINTFEDFFFGTVGVVMCLFGLVEMARVQSAMLCAVVGLSMLI